MTLSELKKSLLSGKEEGGRVAVVREGALGRRVRRREGAGRRRGSPSAGWRRDVRDALRAETGATGMDRDCTRASVVDRGKFMVRDQITSDL